MQGDEATVTFAKSSPAISAANAGERRPLAEEERLVRAAAGGDATAFLVIYDRLANRLYGYVLRRVRKPETAEDIVQEVFLALIRRGASYRARAPLSAFLFRIARNRVINHWRDARPSVELDERPAPAPAYAEIIDVRRALEALPEKFREAIELATYEGLRYGEIAEVVGCPIGTVRSRIARGKRMMAARLQGNSR